MGAVHEKDPNAIKPYYVDWTAWLAGDTIATSTWTASPTGITTSNPTTSPTITQIVLAGGTVGTLYSITNRITTTAGYTDDRTLYIKIEEN